MSLINKFSTDTSDDISVKKANSVPRGINGKWVYCLARIDHTPKGALLTLAAVSDKSSEGAATIFFRSELRRANYFLLKIALHRAQEIWLYHRRAEGADAHLRKREKDS